jgi:hypothetical protein
MDTALAAARLATQPAQAGTQQGAGLLFVENVGQFDARARFQTRAGGFTAWLAEDGLWIAVAEDLEIADTSKGGHSFEAGVAGEGVVRPLRGANLRLSFTGANPAPKMVPFGRSATVVSYLTGNDPAAWRADVPVWAGVRYVDLYPGLDFEVTSVAGRWAWRMVAKGTGSQQASVLSAVRLRVEGSDSLSVVDGAVRLDTGVGELDLPLLQIVDAGARPLSLSTDGPRVDADSVTMPFGTAA